MARYIDPKSLTEDCNINDICGQSVERILKAAMAKESLDNLSVVMIAFKNFTKMFESPIGNSQGM
jgi:hypothetical protein